MSYVISVSLPKDCKDWLDRTGLSPSKILQHAIRQKSMPAFEEEEQLRNKVSLLSDRLNSVLRYMEDRGFNYVADDKEKAAQRRL